MHRFSPFGSILPRGGKVAVRIDSRRGDWKSPLLLLRLRGIQIREEVRDFLQRQFIERFFRHHRNQPFAAGFPIADQLPKVGDELVLLVETIEADQTDDVMILTSQRERHAARQFTLNIEVPLLSVGERVAKDGRRDALPIKDLLKIGTSAWSLNYSVRERISQKPFRGLTSWAGRKAPW